MKNKKILIVLLVLAAVIIMTKCENATGKKEIKIRTQEARNAYQGTEIYTVKANDTLSRIAYLKTPKDQSVKQFINDVKNMNDIKDDIIYFKQNLLLPKF